MCICMCIYVCVLRILTCKYEWTLPLSMHSYLKMYQLPYMYVCMQAHTHVRMHVCNACMEEHLHVCMTSSKQGEHACGHTATRLIRTIVHHHHHPPPPPPCLLKPKSIGCRRRCSGGVPSNPSHAGRTLRAPPRPHESDLGSM